MCRMQVKAHRLIERIGLIDNAALASKGGCR
jgi:hypothetical protein